MRKIIWLLLGGFVVGSALLGLISVHQPSIEPMSSKILANGASFVPTKCWFTSKDSIPAQCGWLNTAPLNGNKTSTFKLPVVILRHTGSQHQSDPVIYLAGGPGAATLLDKRSMESHWLQWFESKLATNRDLILFDQRGTGMSEPAINCHEYRELSVSVLSNPGTPDENARRYREISQQCHDHLLQQGAPLNELGTLFSAQDVNDLLEALGYDKGNLLGVSYGTRLAMEIDLRFPQRVRSMTLDSLYPPGEHLFRDWPDLVKNSLERVFSYCETAERCQLENGNIRELYLSLMSKLRANPLRIPVDNLQINGLQTLHLNDEILLAMLFDAQYSSHNLASLPDMLRHLQSGRTDLVQTQIENYLHHQFDETFHEPVFWTVECGDNPLVPRANMEAKLNTFPELRYYLPYDHDVCDIWNTTTATHTLQTSPAPRITPTLILSGEDDPITPISWANKAAEEQFSAKTTHFFSFADIAHSVMDNKPCANDLFVQFVNDPHERPHADCRFDDLP